MSEQRERHPRDISLRVLRGRNIPPRKNFWKSERRALIVVTSGSCTVKTKAVKSHNGTVEWNETIHIPQGRGERIYITLVDEPRLKRSKPVAKAEVSVESLCQGDPREVSLNVIGANGEDLSHSCPCIVLSASLSEPTDVASNNDSPLTAEAMTSSGTDPSTTELHIPARFDSTAQDVAAAERAISGMGLASATLVDALQATPGAIQSVQDTVDTWQPVLDQIKWVVDVIDNIAEIHPYVKIAWSVLSLIPKGIVNQAARDENVRQLLTTMKDAFDLAKDAETLTSLCETSSQRDILKNMLDQVSECGHFIQRYAGDVTFGKRLLKNVMGSTNSVLERFSSTLVKLRQQFIDHATIVTEVTVFRILDDVRELSDKLADHSLSTKLGRLRYAVGADFDPNKGCLPGTRTNILTKITDWVNDPSAPQILVLFGQAGRGKSSIASEIAKRFRAINRLCTSYVFTRGATDHEREPYRLFTTLARDLSHRCSSFAQSLSKSMDKESGPWNSTNYTTLFDFLFDTRMKDLTFVGPLLVVIDALDEASDASSPDGLHSFLATHLPTLPSHFRFFITSRPEPKIRSSFKPASSIRTMEMDNIEHNQDIKAYMKSTLDSAPIFDNCGEALVAKSEGLFQWAALVCAYINKPPDGLTSEDCIDDVLNATGGLNPLDSIYTLILERFDMKDERIRARFKFMIGVILFATEPVSVAFLAAMQNVSDLAPAENTVKATLNSLGSLLSNVDSPTSPITPLHTSFRDFLTDQSRSRQYHIDPKTAHRDLLTSSLSIMNACLIFNTCHLETSCLPNTRIPSLEALIEEHIPSYLSYACRFWGSHLLQGGVDNAILRACERFMKEKFLFWLEVLSLVNAIEFVPAALQTLASLLHEGDFDLGILGSLVDDALFFVRTNIDPISRSAPHIYLSALMFAPTSSSIFQQYQKWFPSLASTLTYRQSKWSALMRLANEADRYHTISLSPNGQVIATAHSLPRSEWITLWDAATGDQMAHVRFPHGYTQIIASPDCFHVAIKQDTSLSIWNSRTGKVMPIVTTPTRNCCFAFSPDGSRLVAHDGAGTTSLFCVTSGERIRQWVDKRPEPDPFHFMVAAYSSGEQIAICHGDSAVRIWDAETGLEVRVLVSNGSAYATELVFSRDCSLLAASFYIMPDLYTELYEIRLWNTRTWQLVHTETLLLVGPPKITVFPDGEHIAILTQPSDRVSQVDIVDIVPSPLKPQPGRISLQSHLPSYASVFSSDSTSLICFRRDVGNVYIWDMKADLNEVPDHVVDCVAFSPSGKYVVSAAPRPRFHDVRTGDMVAVNLPEQQGAHKGMAFLPGERIALCSSRRLMVLSVETGQIAWQSELQAGDHFEGPLGASADGRLLVTVLPSGPTHGLRCAGWDTDTGECIFGPFYIHSDGISTIPSHVDNGQVLYTPIHPPPTWPHSTTREICTVFVGNDKVLVGVFSNQAVDCAAFSTDGAVLVTADFVEVSVWDLSTAKLSGGPFKWGESRPISIALSPLGDRFATIDAASGVCVWDAKSFELVAGRFKSTTDMEFVKFSHDGRYLATGTHEGVLCLWNIEPEQRCGDASEPTITNDSEINKEGWILGPHDELILWVPPGLRAGFHRPSTVWVRGPRVNEARVDFDKMLCGTRWTDCYSG